ncbi:hypothetical protein BX616_004775 [Lobosporangium transversale]|uniref:WKF domain-containing protein n=1 Tax=Lobosporangium transversale TaxID=64571 RepID=A0A1Y2G9Q6_9FUNG|nr:hypothetical protein BCR41DRAFT_425688 [Lobosporangium transversale]KAF9897913.1 hypothetical protein BX616_004775 [Lobosporangium transversale]ORZ04994.1 hypothetical protein BCR41DRAFT_425688 [Lobosporangium transversale]|eukprot:XP_021876858.1 hypothetical protein BCR41DRAFT_425688 [Lobosporangium transversale]
MSDSNVKRARIPKPEKKKPTTTTETTAAATAADTNTPSKDLSTTAVDEPLINIPAIKKKKERRVKTEEEIAAKQERKRLRKEAEEAKRQAQLAKKGLTQIKTSIQNKTPKWKQFLKNTTEADNAEKLKNISYKVEGDDNGSDSDSDSGSDSDNNENDTKKNHEKKRKADKDAESTPSVKSKKARQEEAAKLATLDTSTPGLAYLVEWKKSRAAWKFQKMRQVWLLNHMYDDKQLPSSHWDIFLEYIRDLKGAARNIAVEEAKKTVDAPEPEDDQAEEQKQKDDRSDEDHDMSDATNTQENEDTVSTIPLSEEEKAAEEAAKEAKIEAKRSAQVKLSRALDVLRILA